MKKIISVICVLALVMALFAGCGGEEAVVTVNGEAISPGEFEYFLLMAKSIIISAGGEDTRQYWETTEIEGKNAGDVAKETALKNAIELTLFAQKAVELGADNSEEIKAKQRENFIRQSFDGSEENYLARLEELGLNDDDVMKVIMKDYLTTEFYSKVDLDTPTDQQIREYYDKNYYRAKHILVAYSNYMSDTSDGRAEALAKIKDIKAELDNGGDFDRLMLTYNEDQAMNDDEKGYVFTKGTIMPKQFEEAVESLEVGEISDIVETDYGYHIIKRLDSSEVYDEFVSSPSNVMQSETETGRDEIASLVEYSQLQTMLEQWKEEADIKINDDLLASVSLVKEAEEKSAQ